MGALGVRCCPLETLPSASSIVSINSAKGATSTGGTAPGGGGLMEPSMLVPCARFPATDSYLPRFVAGCSPLASGGSLLVNGFPLRAGIDCHLPRSGVLTNAGERTKRGFSKSQSSHALPILRTNLRRSWQEIQHPRCNPFAYLSAENDGMTQGLLQGRCHRLVDQTILSVSGLHLATNIYRTHSCSYRRCVLASHPSRA